MQKIEKSEELSKYQKTCLLLAIYDKDKKINAAKNLIKSYKRETTSKEEKKVLNLIMQRIQSKKVRIFDYGFYDEILHWYLDDR